MADNIILEEDSPITRKQRHERDHHEVIHEHYNEESQKINIEELKDSHQSPLSLQQADHVSFRAREFN